MRVITDTVTRWRFEGALKTASHGRARRGEARSLVRDSDENGDAGGGGGGDGGISGLVRCRCTQGTGL